MDNLKAISGRGDDENNGFSNHKKEETTLTDPTPITALAEVAASVLAAVTPDDANGDVPSSSADGIATVTTTTTATPDTETDPLTVVKDEHLGYEEVSDDEISGNALKAESGGSPKFTRVSDDDDDFEEEEPPPKKQKQLSNLDQLAEIAATPSSPVQPRVKRMSTAAASASASASANATPSTAKKSKKKSNNVWTKSTSRKGKKKPKNNSNNTPTEDTVMITPVARFPDKSDDSPNSKICLSKVYKAEKVELSDDRMTAGSTKGYRMVRATRGVVEGAWYFEIKIVKLGETGHTRLGWSTEKGDLQAPVGYDANSFAYRDIDGSKVHKALRENYGDAGYTEGDVIGFYISLPDGEAYAPKPPHLVWYKGQRYACAPDGKEDPPKVVPGSQISFFKNGICQGIAFEDLYGGRYYPAASMYTLPNQPNCTVKFNFGPDFEFFPADFDGRPAPRPMAEVAYHGYDGKVENGVPRASIRRCPTLKIVDEHDINLVEDLDV